MPKAPVVSVVLAIGLGACVVCVALGAFGSAPAFADEPVNACGCYRDDQGTCRCTRKCGCPEECEPMGCEQKRQREADKAAEATLKQIAAREKQKAKESGKDGSKKPAEGPHAKTGKRDKATERAERAAQEAMKAAL